MTKENGNRYYMIAKVLSLNLKSVDLS